MMAGSRDDFFRWFLRGALAASVVGTAAFVVTPLLGVSQHASRTMGEVIIRQLPEVVVGVGFAFIGGCLGSFLNVVVYRTPRGLSLMGSSMCPFCKVPIAPADNLPVLAWLRLGGKCRQCGLPIAARYPMVEFAVALLVLALAIVEIGAGGANLSVQSSSSLAGFSTHLFDPVNAESGNAIVTFVWHVACMILLLGMALIIEDGNSIPRSLSVFGWAGVVVVAAVYPAALYGVRRPPSEYGVVHATLGIAIGAAVGWVVGWLLSMDERSRGLAEYRGLAPIFSLAGAAFGWPAVMFCGAVTPMLGLAYRLLGNRDEPQSLTFVATLAFYLLSGYPLLRPYLDVMPV